VGQLNRTQMNKEQVRLPLLGRNTCQLEEAELVMASTISFFQANLQHSIAASRILTRTVGVKEIDVALI
jgi:hypothetical protein